MNQYWSEKNKNIQSLLKKLTLEDAVSMLLDLRNDLMCEMNSWKEILSKEDYSKMPYVNASGYHSKTVAYSIYHIIRIEDIVVNTLIQNKEELFFKFNYKQRMNSSIITTGNELEKEDLKLFSSNIEIDELYNYVYEVKGETEKFILSLGYDDLKKKFNDEDKKRIVELRVVSDSPKARWLLDYWTGKDLKGLILMPLSRHWIMHVEAANRIIEKIKKTKSPK